MTDCAATDLKIGLVRGVLGGMECHTRVLARTGYEALGAANSPYQAWLTALLAIYVAVIGYRLLLGAGGRTSELPLSALKIGAVLALTANWALFEGLVFDVVTKGAWELARMVTLPMGQQSAFAGDPVGALQVSYDQLTLSAAAFGKAAGPMANPAAGGSAAAAAALWQAAQALFFSTAGVFSVAMAVSGVLTALGPVFVALLLFDATRGLFVGWLRALLLSAFLPMAGWPIVALTLSMLEPQLTILARQRVTGGLDVDTALATASFVFVIAAVQLGVAAVAALIASGFTPFSRSKAELSVGASAVAATASAIRPPSRPERLAQALDRQYGALLGAGRLGATSIYSSTTTAAASVFAGPGAALDGLRRPSIRRRSDFSRGRG